MSTLTFRKRLDLSVLPGDWTLVRVSLDWNGSPLLLFDEGKPPEPAEGDTPQAWSLWYRIPARAHHLIHWDGDKPRTLRLEQSQAPSTYHVQPLGEGWLLGERRRGRATVYDMQGRISGTLDLGDASEDIQTTADGRIWVSYFEEGIFGGGIGREGAVCFSSAGAPLFRYRAFAEKQGLPLMTDCCAMNVASDGEVWLNYASEFPLVLLRSSILGGAEAGDPVLEGLWPAFGSMANSFAIRGMEAVCLREGRWTRLALDHDSPPEIADAVDELGFPLGAVARPGPAVAARGASLAVHAGHFIYELAG